MEHLNYCRQMVKQFANSICMPSFKDEHRKVLSHAIDLAQASQKFMLPNGGRLYDDPEYRSLDEQEPLKLPYQFVALEYYRGYGKLDDGLIKSSKVIVFARERDDVIVVMPIMWNEANGRWGPLPEISIPRIGYLDRKTLIDGRVGVRAFFPDARIAQDYMDEIGALLCFLNVLKCNNVHIEQSEPKRKGKKIKAALAFDTYHVLTIDVGRRGNELPGAGGGNHRSPREHLRRGHIRRLSDGRRVWVNAAVVGAGKGSGVITKDYQVRRHG